MSYFLSLWYFWRDDSERVRNLDFVFAAFSCWYAFWQTWLIKMRVLVWIKPDSAFTHDLSTQPFPLVLRVVRQGGHRGLDECREQFKNDIWNCSLDNKQIHKRFPIFVKTTLPYGNVYSLTSLISLSYEIYQWIVIKSLKISNKHLYWLLWELMSIGSDAALQHGKFLFYEWLFTHGGALQSAYFFSGLVKRSTSGYLY